MTRRLFLVLLRRSLFSAVAAAAAIVIVSYGIELSLVAQKIDAPDRIHAATDVFVAAVVFLGSVFAPFLVFSASFRTNHWAYQAALPMARWRQWAAGIAASFAMYLIMAAIVLASRPTLLAAVRTFLHDQNLSVWAPIVLLVFCWAAGTAFATTVARTDAALILCVLTGVVVLFLVNAAGLARRPLLYPDWSDFDPVFLREIIPENVFIAAWILLAAAAFLWISKRNHARGEFGSPSAAVRNGVLAVSVAVIVPFGAWASNEVLDRAGPVTATRSELSPAGRYLLLQESRANARRSSLMVFDIRDGRRIAAFGGSLGRASWFAEDRFGVVSHPRSGDETLTAYTPSGERLWSHRERFPFYVAERDDDFLLLRIDTAWKVLSPDGRVVAAGTCPDDAWVQTRCVARVGGAVAQLTTGTWSFIEGIGSTEGLRWAGARNASEFYVVRGEIFDSMPAALERMRALYPPSSDMKNAPPGGASGFLSSGRTFLEVRPVWIRAHPVRAFTESGGQFVEHSAEIWMWQADRRQWEKKASGAFIAWPPKSEPDGIIPPQREIVAVDDGILLYYRDRHAILSDGDGEHDLGPIKGNATLPAFRLAENGAVIVMNNWADRAFVDLTRRRLVPFARPKGARAGYYWSFLEPTRDGALWTVGRRRGISPEYELVVFPPDAPPRRLRLED